MLSKPDQDNDKKFYRKQPAVLFIKMMDTVIMILST